MGDSGRISVSVGGDPITPTDAAGGLEGLLLDVAAERHEFVIFEGADGRFLQACAGAGAPGSLVVEESKPGMKRPVVLGEAMSAAECADAIRARFGQLDLAALSAQPKPRR